MEVNIKGINNLYTERYIETKKMIDSFHAMIQDGTLDDDLEKADKISIEILNNLVDKQ